MPKNISTIIAQLCKSVGIDTSDPKYVDLINVSGTVGDDVYGEVEAGMRGLLTLDQAKNSSDLKRHFTHPILDPADKELLKALDLLEFDDDTKTGINTETSTYKKLAKTIEKAKEKMDTLKAKAEAGGKGSGDAQKQIDALNLEVKNAKADAAKEIAAAKAETAKQLENFVDFQILSGKKYANDKAKPELNVASARQAIDMELVTRKAKRVYNPSTNSYELYHNDDSGLKYQENNTDINYAEFVDGILAANGLLKQTDSPDATPDGNINRPTNIQASDKTDKGRNSAIDHVNKKIAQYGAKTV